MIRNHPFSIKWVENMETRTIFHRVSRKINRKTERGQGMAEYALLIALTGVVLVGALAAMGPAIGAHYHRIIDAFGINTTADVEEEEELPGGEEEEEEATPTPIPTANIDVYVVDGSSVGITGVEVAVYQDGSPYKGITGTTGANGKVSFTLNVGSYSFVAAYNGHDYPSPSSYTLPDTSAATIQISQPEFTVKVVDSLNQPMSGVTVTLHNTSGAYLNVSAVTNSSGNAVLNVPGSVVKFKAVVGGNNYWSAEVDTQTATTTTITIPIADYTITVLNGGGIIKNASVTVLLADGSSTGITGSTGSNGKVTVTLSPGSYKFQLKKGKNTWVTGSFAFPESNPLTIDVGS